MSGGERGPARSILGIADIVRTIAESATFDSYELVRAGEHEIELKYGDGSALLAMPEIWREPEQVAAQLARSVSPSTLLFCLGSGEDMAEAAKLRQTSLVFCLILPTSPAALHASLANSMALIAMQRRAEERGQAAERLRYELAELIAIAGLLNSERDIGRLLGLILEKSRYITGADAGSVYVVVPDREDQSQRKLRFEAAQNESVEVGDLEVQTLPISSKSIVGAAVNKEEVINIPDLDLLDSHNPWGVAHNRSFDEAHGYQTRSMLTVPMINHRDDVIGVIQLINKKNTPGQPLRSAQDFADHVVPFDERSVELCKTLAYQAAIALDNALLYDELRTVFEGFVDASVRAIEARDPTTSGHSRRVADLTVELAVEADGLTQGPYAGLRFSSDELKEIEYAGLLHDFGKVGVKENVLLKSHKLYEWDLQQLLLRFDFIRERLRNEALGRKLEAALAGGASQRARLDAIQVALQKQEDYLELCRETILKANLPTVLESDSAALLEEIAQHSYVDAAGETRPYLTPEELACLRIRRGSLSIEERAEIESHVVHSWEFLCKIPWGRTFGRIPIIAGDHHEKLDGTGYPRGKDAAEIPVQAKMMTIADIFDALTASDRPYKRAMPCERALDIIGGDVKRGKVDEDLFRLFVEAKVYRKVLP